MQHTQGTNIFTTSGIISKTTSRCPPTATPESYPPYRLFFAQLIFDPRFVEHSMENQQKILDWIEQEFFIYMNDMRSKRIRTEHAKKKKMFWTIADKILNKYVSGLSFDDNEQQDNSGASIGVIPSLTNSIVLQIIDKSTPLVENLSDDDDKWRIPLTSTFPPPSSSIYQKSGENSEGNLVLSWFPQPSLAGDIKNTLEEISKLNSQISELFQSTLDSYLQTIDDHPELHLNSGNLLE
jgi:hypothetical protein